MRIVNKTKWRTEHLRAFARAVADRTLDPEHRKTLLVEFRNARTRGVAGYAYYNFVWDRRNGRHRYARITLPSGTLTAFQARFLKKWDVTPEMIEAKRAEWVAQRTPNKRALAAVLEHEMLHTVGQKHPGDHGSHTMRGHYDDQTLAVERYDWAEALPLERV